jgi:hypothetical protein
MHMSKTHTDEIIYKIKVFTSTKAKYWDEIIDIYSQNVKPNIRTSTNEIEHWIENYEKINKDTFRVIGLFANDEPIGYCQYAYFEEEQLVFIDYIVIPNGSLPIIIAFKDLLRKYFYSEHRNIKYLIGEVACHLNYAEGIIPFESKKMLRLFELLGFAEIKAHYFSPMLGHGNIESKMWAILIISITGTEYDLHKPQLSKSKYLEIIKVIYYKHYGRWYKAFLSDIEMMQYNIHLDDLFAQIEGDTKEELIAVNGETPWPPPPNRKKNFGIKNWFIAVFIFVFIGIFALALFMVIKNKISADIIRYIYWVFYIIIAILTSIFGTMKTNFGRMLRRILRNLFID